MSMSLWEPVFNSIIPDSPSPFKATIQNQRLWNINIKDLNITLQKKDFTEK